MKVTVKPIHDDDDHATALTRIEELWGAEAGTPEGDELDVLVTLVDAYETEHHEIEAPDPVALIKHMMEARGLKAANLEPIIGSSGRVSEVLNYRRRLTLPMIRRLHSDLGLPADPLIKDYPLQDHETA